MLGETAVKEADDRRSASLVQVNLMGLPVESAAGFACGFGHGKGTASTLKLYRVRSGHMAHEAEQTIRRAWLPSFPLFVIQKLFY